MLNTPAQGRSSSSLYTAESQGWDSRLWIGIMIVLVLIVAYGYYLATRPANIFRDNYYFDYNATTPLLPAARSAMIRAQYLGNASAQYATEAKTIIERTKRAIERWANLEAGAWTILFTSGGSESICTYLRGAATPQCTIYTSAAEHKTTLMCVAALPCASQILPVEIDGAINPNTLRSALASRSSAEQPAIVTLVAANNETGTLTDIAAVSAICRAAGARLHLDAVQTFGKYPGIGGYCDAFSASAHKFGGPQGVGLLCYRHDARPDTIIHGTQQNGGRGGTENIAGIAGLGAAIEHIHLTAATATAHMAKLTRHIAADLQRSYRSEELAKFVAAGARDDLIDPYRAVPAGTASPIIVPITGSAGRESLPNTLQFAIITPGKFFCNIKFRDALARRKIIIAVGSACNSASAAPNHVMAAIGAPRIIRSGVVRISLGPETRWSDVDALLAAIPLAIAEQGGIV